MCNDVTAAVTSGATGASVGLGLQCGCPTIINKAHGINDRDLMV